MANAEHKLIQGGEIWLPFARNCIKRLRATGLAFSSQKFDMGDGAVVRVRIAPGHDYISIDGGSWLVFPMNPAVIHPGPAYRWVHRLGTFTPKTGGALITGPFWSLHETATENYYADNYVDGRYAHDTYGYDPTSPNLSFDGEFVDRFAINGPIGDYGIPEDVYQMLVKDVITMPSAVGTVSETPPAVVLEAELGVFGALWTVSHYTKIGYNPGPDFYTEETENYGDDTAGTAFVNEKRVEHRSAMIAAHSASLDLGHLSPVVADGSIPTYPKSRTTSNNLPIKIISSEATSQIDPADNISILTVAQIYEITDPITSSSRTSEGTKSIKTYWNGRQVFTYTNFLAPATGYASVPDLRNPDYQNGYFMSGVSDRAPPFTSSVTYSIPNEYKKYAKRFHGFYSEGHVDNENLRSDGLVAVGDFIFYIYLEYEAYDPFNNEWAWVSEPQLFLQNPIRLISFSYNFARWTQEIKDSAIRKVRIKKMRAQKRIALGDLLTWESPVDVTLTSEALAWVGDIENKKNPGDYVVPCMVAVLNKAQTIALPSTEFDDEGSGVIHSGNYAKARLAGIQTSGYTSDATTDGWVDVLVIEILKQAGCISNGKFVGVNRTRYA